MTHNNEQYDDDDEEQFLLMTGTGRQAGSHQIIKRNMHKCKQHSYFHLIVLCQIQKQKYYNLK